MKKGRKTQRYHRSSSARKGAWHSSKASSYHGVAIISVVFLFILAVVLIFTNQATQNTPDVNYVNAVTAKPYTSQRNINYCVYNGINDQVDLYTPVNPTSSMPLIIYVHGGGWSQGDKSEITTVANFVTVLNALTSNGYLVASVNYRLAPTNPFPAMAQDIKCAIRFFRANASAYRVDPTRIGIWGTSSGGHLASLMAVTNTQAGWDTGQYVSTSSRVEAAVIWYGAENLNEEYALGGAPQTAVMNAFGSDSATLANASPVTYVTSDDAPYLLQHGTSDNTAPYSQAQEIYDLLVAANVSARLVPVSNAGHGFIPVPTTAVISPSISQLANQMVNFYNMKLKNNPAPLPQ